MPRSTDSQKRQRLNAAYGLLTRGLSTAEACVSLSDQFALSRRQAYRYVQEAQSLMAPLPLREAAIAVTFKLPPSLIQALRQRAASEGMTLSDTVAEALSVYLGRAPDHGA
ncbi:MAG: hypothetical protein K9L88_11910 [Chromatiaceae bacterium]|nr:hypothetical protein [Chromatiaceae bacterium]